MRLFPSAHIYPAGSVAVLLNLDTTPVQLRTTPFQTADPTGARNSSYLVVPLVERPDDITATEEAA